MKPIEQYGLDLHGTMILEEYRDHLADFAKMKEIVLHMLGDCLKQGNMIVNTIEGRVKTEASLAGKLELKGQKYKDLSDITDIVGARVVTFYTEEVDKIAALVDKLFDIDWENSVDKRKQLGKDTFGYMSLHYICRIPTSVYNDPEHPAINQYRFEVQMRTALQHVWASMNHDIGYKTGVEVPPEHLRSLTRLAGILELADEEFSRIRKEITDYRRKAEQLVKDGNFDAVSLNGDTWRSYLALDPFASLSNKIAAINQGEVYEDDLMPYYNVLLHMNMKTIGDIVKMYSEHAEGAYQLALLQLAGTGLDIVTYSVAVQNLCIVAILKKGYGEAGLVRLFEALYGENDYHQQRAKRIYEQAQKINLV